MISVKGLGVSPGVARGEALVLRQRARHRYYLVPAGAVDREVARLVTARDRGRGQLEEITQRIATLAGAAPASLFEAQLLMLDDPMLLQRASDLIRARRQNAEWAVQQAGDELAEMFNQADDPYLRERKGDLQDVIGRLRMNLTGEAGQNALVSPTGAPCIIVADDLPPSVAAQIEWTRTLGFITDPADPRRAVAACPGAPACANGSTAVRTDADAFAAAASTLLQDGMSLHVSGCSKGCARRQPASLTLVAEAGRYGLVVNGPASAAACGRFTPQQAAETLARLASAMTKAGDAPDREAAIAAALKEIQAA